MRQLLMGLASLVVLALCACSPYYDSLDIDQISGSGQVSNDGIEVEEGRVMLIRARPIARGANRYQRFDVVELESLNASVVYVEGAREVDQFVVGGVSVGDARILVRVNGRDEDEFFARVIPQEVR
jgi:hypothetical protein